MKLLITGADGFIAKNLRVHLAEIDDIEVVCFSRNSDPNMLKNMVADVDFVFHLAGVNRSENEDDFTYGNHSLTEILCQAVKETNRQVPIVYSSSIQAELDNVYGRSKRLAEDALLSFSSDTGAPVYIYRLPNVFGKWSRPNYNSAVATFCHNINKDIPIVINSADAVINLVYIDDVVESFKGLLFDEVVNDDPFQLIDCVYKVTVGELAKTLNALFMLLT